MTTRTTRTRRNTALAPKQSTGIDDLLSLAPPPLSATAPIPVSRRKRRTATAIHAMLPAYHEAGHAFVAWYLGVKILRVSLDPPSIDTMPEAWDRLSHVELGGIDVDETRSIPGCPAMWQLGERHVQFCLAGYVAERIYSPRRWRIYINTSHYSSEDWETAGIVARLLHPNDTGQARKWLGEQERRTSRLLRTQWPCVQALAEWLHEEKDIDGHDVAWLIMRTLLPSVRRFDD